MGMARFSCISSSINRLDIDIKHFTQSFFRTHSVKMGMINSNDRKNIWAYDLTKFPQLIDLKTYYSIV